MPRLCVWADADQQELVRATADAAGMELVAIGAFDPDEARDLAEGLEVPRLDDLRQAIVHDQADVIWIAAAGAIEGDERRALRERATCTVSTEPRPVILADFLQNPEEAKTATTVPLLRRSPVYRAAREALAEFGPVDALRVECLGRPGEGTLSARLYDAVDVVAALLGQVEALDAAVPMSGEPAPSSRPAVHGHLTALVRGERGAATIMCSDRAGAWHRCVTLLGPRGTLRLHDGGYTWHDETGAEAECFAADGSTTLPALIADQMRRTLEQLDEATEPPADVAARLALCEAARLSCRTRQPEAPDSVRRMLERV